jgi:uncharacterized protein YndB with AHSA1/START domain
MTAILAQRRRAGVKRGCGGMAKSMNGTVATATVDIAASSDRVWAALTDPAQIREYMMGAEVDTDWRVGSPITWKGEFNGTAYEDKGEILAYEPRRRLEMTHFSPLTGAEDKPENYHRVVFDLEDVDRRTRVNLSQDGNASAEEAEHSARNWQQMLEGLKQVAESR